MTMSPDGAPIDRGWAWMCVLGGGTGLFFMVGGIRSLGILLLEIIIRFDTTSAIGSLMMGVIAAIMSISAPIANYLGARYSYRIVVMVGGSMAAFGAFLTAFATNTYYIITLFGIFTGIGYACMFGPVMVVIGQYFCKRRSIANGLASSCGSLGQLVIPLLIRTLLDAYGFMGGMLIYGAFCLHILPAGALLRPLAFWDKRPKPKPKVTESNGKLPTSVHRQPGRKVSICLPDGHQAVGNGDIDSGDEDRLVHAHEIRRRPSIVSGGSASSKTLKRGSTYMSTSSLAIQPHQDAPGTPQPKDQGTSGQTCTQTCSATMCCCCVDTTHITPFIEWSLFRNYLFIIYIIGICLGNTGYINAMLFLPPYADELNVPKSTAALLISCVGVADLVGRIFGGWFADLGLMKRSKLMAISLSVTGLVAVIITFFPCFQSLVVVSIVLGLIGGFYVSLQAVILVDFLGIEKLSSSFGLSVMMQGFTNIFVPTGLGMIKDVTGSYMVTYLSCGIMMMLSGIFFALENVARRLEEAKHPVPDSNGVIKPYDAQSEQLSELESSV